MEKSHTFVDEVAGRVSITPGVVEADESEVDERGPGLGPS